MLNKYLKPFVVKSFLVGLALGASHASAIDLKPEEVRGNVQNSPVTILQNRYFLKALRPEFGLVFGTLLNEAYTDTTLSGMRLGLFVNEWIGLEVQALNGKSTDSDDRKALRQQSYLDPQDPGKTVKADVVVNRIQKTLDTSVVIAPFYGKINLADWLIIYSDLYVSGGFSKLETDVGSINGFNYGLGQRFYWQKSLSFRVDFKSRMYTENLGSLTNDSSLSTQATEGKSRRKSTYSVDFGLSYFFL